MAAGTIPPTMMETANHKPIAVVGSSHPLLLMFTSKRIAPNNEIRIKRFKAGR